MRFLFLPYDLCCVLCADNIEANVEVAQVRVEDGNKQLTSTVRHKVGGIGLIGSRAPVWTSFTRTKNLIPHDMHVTDYTMTETSALKC